MISRPKYYIICWVWWIWRRTKRCTMWVKRAIMCIS